MHRPITGCLLLLLTIAVGCAGTAAEERTVASSPEAAAAPRGAAASSDLEALAVKTLSEHLASPAESIEVVSLEPVDWPDSSLGCPRPDFSYLQVITPGHVAVLRQGGATYRVHMAGNRAFICDRTAEKGAKETLPTVGIPLSREQLETLARADFARRLGVPVEQVSVTSAKPMVWQDLSLGCPEEGQSYRAAAVKGYVLDLSYRGRIHRYHTDRYRVLPCPPIQAE